MKKIGVLFPGQASQYVGMGREFAKKDPAMREILETGERITGLSLVNLCFEGPIEELTRTLNCQPAVYGVSLICWEMVRRRIPFPPAGCAGHSVGEYTALVASGVIDAAEGFYLIRKRAQYIETICRDIDGGMIAVIGRSPGEIEQLLESFPELDIANINAPQQIVVSGLTKDIRHFEEHLLQRKIRAIPLRVSGPFHSRHMKPAGDLLAVELSKVSFKQPLMPVFLNGTGEKTTDVGTIMTGLPAQLSSPVRWTDTIINMAADGMDIFIEIGPKKVLKGLVEKILPSATVLNVEDMKTLGETEQRLNELLSREGRS